MKDFFISYTKADKAWAEWIAWTLEEASRLVIIQAWDFRPGGNFVLDMQRAASGTEKTIVVLSPAYLEAEYTQPEWAAALAQDPDGKQRKLIPIRVAECRPTGILAPITYVDLLGLPQDDARAVLLGAFSERAKPSSMPAFPGAQPSDVSAARPVYPGTINATAASTAKILVTLVESADQSRRLSASQRLRFTRQLNSILPQQFNMLLFAANPEPGLVPPMPAAQGDRISALLTWAEGPGGCGLSVLQELLETILQSPVAPTQSVQSKRNLITSIEFTLDRPFAEFNEAEFKIALKLATGIEASQIHIASIRSGSTIVQITGEHEALATIIQKIRFSQQVAHQLALQTGMRRVVWDIDGTRYELLINRLPDSGRANVSTPEPDIPVLRQKKIRRVVVIMHGIRDEGEWMPPLERLIRDETGAEAQSLNIDRISLTRFLLAERFLGYVKSYSDSALQLLSNYNEADVFFIAHSYGTWCLRDLLNNWPYKGNIMPTGIIVCGSILPMNCPWGKIHSSIFKRPRQDAELPWVWNDIGGRDPFPLLARVVSEGYGDSGVNRFTDATPKLIVNRVHGRLDHGGFFITHENGHNVLNKEFVRAYWLPIIRGEDAPREGVEPRISPFIKRLSYWVKNGAGARPMDYDS